MPAIGYKYFKIEHFPEIRMDEALQTATQLTLLPWGDDSLHSTISFLGRSEHPDFDKYHVEHETLRSLQVRFENVRRDQVIAIVHFNIFRCRTDAHFWVGTRQRYAFESLANVKATHPDVEVKRRSADLISLRQAAVGGDVTGGWFRQLQISGVRAAGIFGPGVSESEEWDRYEQAGELSALTLEFVYRGNPQSAMVTSDGGIVVYGSFTEEETLAFLEEVNKLIEPFATELEPISLARWRKR